MTSGLIIINGDARFLILDADVVLHSFGTDSQVRRTNIAPYWPIMAAIVMVFAFTFHLSATNDHQYEALSKDQLKSWEHLSYTLLFSSKTDLSQS
jgi:hypothetical protein